MWSQAQHLLRKNNFMTVIMEKVLCRSRQPFRARAARAVFFCGASMPDPNRLACPGPGNDEFGGVRKAEAVFTAGEGLQTGADHLAGER